MTRRKMNDGYYMPRLYDFLSRLRDNNYREWFKANKAEYDDLRAAWIEDIDRMIALMGHWEPAIAMANSGKPPPTGYIGTRVFRRIKHPSRPISPLP